MDLVKLFLILSSLVIYSVAKPRPMDRYSSLEMAAGKTACPFIVEEDVNDKRIPHRIKHIVCKGGGRECCKEGYSCIQLVDRISARYRDDPEDEWPLDVRVGCACIKTVSKPKHPEEPDIA